MMVSKSTLRIQIVLLFFSFLFFRQALGKHYNVNGIKFSNENSFENHNEDEESDFDADEDSEATTHRSDVDLVEVELEVPDKHSRDGNNITDYDSEIWTPVPFLTEPEVSSNNVISDSKIFDSSLDELYTESRTENNNSTDLPFHLGSANCTCGKGFGRIVGGETAKINELPWTALLYRRNFFNIRSAYCGGSLINNRYVVTASHCVDGMRARGIEVDLNEENTASVTDRKTYTFKVEKIIMHPDYSRKTIDNDIALLKLAVPVEFNESGPLAPVCFPKNGMDTFSGQIGIAAGWGATRPGGSVSKVLKRVSVPIISNEECRQTDYKDKITDRMLCAGNIKEGGKDSCQGDSGGPLVVELIDGRKLLVGVVSWGYGCAAKNRPGVYCRTNQYINWILKNTEDAAWCNE